jgi:hypothetical protein
MSKQTLIRKERKMSQKESSLQSVIDQHDQLVADDAADSFDLPGLDEAEARVAEKRTEEENQADLSDEADCEGCKI